MGNYSLCYLPGMAISRRQFFRGLVGQSEDRERELEKRRFAVESYVRTNLLPYDFSLTAEQTTEVLAAAVAATDIEGDGELLTYDHRTRLREIVEARVDRWREEYLRADAQRRDALGFVKEFLSLEASPEQLQRLTSHFNASDPTILKEEVERQVRHWLSDLSNSRVANWSNAELRDLVFSEIRSWC